jgi:hypothetical protein
MSFPDEVKVSLVTAVCILALAAVSKSFPHTNIDLVSSYGPLWLFIVYIATKEHYKGSRKSKCGSTWLWSLAIAAVTAAIMAVYIL